MTEHRTEVKSNFASPFSCSPPPSGTCCAPPVPVALPLSHRITWTDIHYRQLFSIISKHTSPWTEMAVAHVLWTAQAADTFCHPALLDVSACVCFESRMDWTDIHYRQLARIISKRTWLWTEMVVDRTVLNAEPLDKWLWFPPEQHPIVLQVRACWPGAGPGAGAGGGVFGVCV
jgi:tRNA-dihydrouridine synthase A